MSIVLVGSTSGSITLQEPAVAGTTVLTLPAVTGTVLTDTSPKAGNVIQVVNAQTTTQVEASFASATDLGLSASITPSSSSSKILVLVSANGLGSRGADWNGWVVRGSTNIGAFGNYIAANTTTTGFWGASVGILDSPATTSSTTYKLQGIRQSGSTNCIFNISTGTAGTGTISTITLLEIAA
jgi:hypothetical protein